MHLGRNPELGSHLKFQDFEQSQNIQLGPFTALAAPSSPLPDPKNDNQAVEPLDASARQVLKGSLVPLKPVAANDTYGLTKYGAVRQLALTEGETDEVAEQLSLASRVVSQHHESQAVSAMTLDVFRAFERPAIPALRPGHRNSVGPVLF
jgi:hypothetical protein